MMNTGMETMIVMAWTALANLGSFTAIIVIYTKIIRRQAKIEYLVKRLCQHSNISTETEL